MELTTRSSGAGSRNSGTYSPETAETLRFEEEIQSLMHPAFDSPPVNNSSSFTALLGLPPNQAVELLHHPITTNTNTSTDSWRFRPTFPSNAALVDRAARFSIFATEEPPEVSNSGEISPVKLKAEPDDSFEQPICPVNEREVRVTGKRKEGQRSKVKGPAKKSKGGEDNNRSVKAVEEEEKQQLPYVHVRARRGQATDSHSLAERARREKINARMKLLQALVPGCSKISGTALVLDEIINHVQSLQRQVEFLSMRLAEVNPRIDFSGLDTILSSEHESSIVNGIVNAPTVLALEQSAWSEGTANSERRHQQQQQQQQQQMWHVDMVRQQQQQPQDEEGTVWERDDTHNNCSSHVCIGPSSYSSLFCYDSSAANSVALPTQLKTEL